MYLNRTIITSLLFAIAALSAPALNKLTPVHLRIEGEANTIFEGIVLTRGHNVTTPSGGSHSCNGLNNNANPSPGATCTSALADASHLFGFTFDGPFFPEFDDFQITAIGGNIQTATQFWGLLNNFQFTPVGGCQQEVTSTDHVLFAFDAFSKTHFLKLSGPNAAHVGKPATFTVIDGMSGAPVAGASVFGQTSTVDGTVSVTFASSGLKSLKASKSDSIRSNAIPVVVL